MSERVASEGPERVVSLGEHSFELMGEELRVGQAGPDVVLRDAEGIFTQNRFALLGDTNGKTRLISVVPSITTSVCDAQTRRVNELAGQLHEEMGDTVAVLTVSADLPMAQKSWCAASDVQRVKMVSDHADLAFGAAWGTGIIDLRLNQRALFVVDSDNIIRYAEYMPDFDEHPDFTAAVNTLRATAQAGA